MSQQPLFPAATPDPTFIGEIFTATFKGRPTNNDLSLQKLFDKVVTTKNKRIAELEHAVSYYQSQNEILSCLLHQSPGQPTENAG